jgi:hypothetical protein
MCKYKVQELVALADDMASSAACLGQGAQNYQHFVDCREKLVKHVHDLQECEHKKS